MYSKGSIDKITSLHLKSTLCPNVLIINNKQGYALKNWVEGLSDKALVNPTFASEQKEV